MNKNRFTKHYFKAKHADYSVTMSFGKMSEPLSKIQHVDSTSTAESYSNAYKYEDTSHPTAPTMIGHDQYTYDANGNPTLVTNDSTHTSRQMSWDEDNRLMTLSDNGVTSRYTYNAAGERIIKSSGTMEGVYVNGAPQGITFHETDNFTMYPASIMSVNKNRFTKHYFIGDKRVASRIGTGTFNNVYGRNGSNITAGQQDYAERMSEIEAQKEEYYKQLGIAPGLPTMKGSYGDPHNTGVGYNTIITELGDHSVPNGWGTQTPTTNSTPNSTPNNPPIGWNDPSNTQDPPIGYGYQASDTTTNQNEETYYYHTDHLGSTAYVTDDKANITQYDAYLPYGELLVDEHSSQESLPYKFNGKEMDSETGLYYYGARYLNPAASVWYGVDPLAEKYPSIGGYVYTADNPVKLIDLDGRKPTANEAARMAVYVYGDKAKLIGGWKVSKLNTKIRSQMKLTKLWQNGLQSEIFERKTKNGNEYAYVFAGTNSVEDGLESVGQLVGASPQYGTAINNARTLSKELWKSELTFVGHSLGGGEAAAASMATGRGAITFNRSSVSDLTKLFYGLGEPSKVTDYRAVGGIVFRYHNLEITYGGDPLTNFQNNLHIGTNGKTNNVNVGTKLTHGIKNFLNYNLK